MFWPETQHFVTNDYKNIQLELLYLLGLKHKFFKTLLWYISHTIKFTLLNCTIQGFVLFCSCSCFWLCSAARGTRAPQPGIRSLSSAMKGMSPNHWTAREFPKLDIWFFLIYLFEHTGSWLWHAGSCVIQTLSCCMWDLVPWPGLEPWLPALGTWRFIHWTTWEVPLFFFGHASWLVGFSTQPGIDSMPPAMEGWNPNRWTTREFPQWFLIYSQLYTYHQYLI